jgi:molybdopterin synthase sulfur carrier subunit
VVRVTVKVFGGLIDITGWRERVYELEEGATVGKLLEKLAAEYPKLKQILEDETGARPTVLVNGRSIEFLRGEETALNDGDTVAIIPPAGGG